MPSIDVRYVSSQIVLLQGITLAREHPAGTPFPELLHDVHDARHRAGDEEEAHANCQHQKIDHDLEAVPARAAGTVAITRVYLTHSEPRDSPVDIAEECVEDCSDDGKHWVG